jgi:hypothetical protein
MTTIEIRQNIEQNLKQLSPEKLNLAAKIVAYLADIESQEATEELLDIPGFIEAFEKGKEDIAAGRLTSWQDLKRKY